MKIVMYMSSLEGKLKMMVVKKYYVIPCGDINKNETLEENVIRELKEEFSVDVNINGYLGKDKNEFE